MEMNLISLIVFVCAILIIAIALYAWLQGKSQESRIFAIFMLSMSIYILGYSFELSSLKIETMLFWNKFQYLGILTFPTLYLVFTSRFSGNDKWLGKNRIAFLFVFPLIFMLFKVFDDSLHLIYQSTSLDTRGLIPLLAFETGPLYYLIVAYNLVMVTLSTFMIFRRRRHASSLYLRQTNIILIVSVFLYASYLIYLSGFTLVPELEHLDLNPFTYTLWGLAISYAILRYRLLDLAPIAREALIEILEDGVLVLDEQFRLVDANPKAHSIFNWEKTPVGLTPDQIDPNLIDLSLVTSVQGEFCYEKRIIRNGRAIDFEITLSILRNSQKMALGYLLVLHDFTRRKKVEMELHELSLIDDLTKLCNRRGFFILSEQLVNFCLRMKMNAVMLFVDMDNLKMINDQQGHAAGDQALVDLGQILLGAFRSSDIVARLGGDEFVVLAIETSENPRDKMIERLEEQRETFSAENARAYAVTFSVGTAIMNWERPRSLEVLLEESDQSMYLAKTAKLKN